MPRRPRILSRYGTYHVMLRGNERKNIFVDNEDKSRLIDTILEKKKAIDFKIYAYCIMDNHIHLVIKESAEPVSNTIKRIATSYARYYNKKNRRVGHVFQDRFKSENIEDERYLLSALRYVHNNPYKAGICKQKDYRWSSMCMYLNYTEGLLKIPEIKEILDMFEADMTIAVTKFVEFSSQNDEDSFIDIEDGLNYNPEREVVEKYINKYLESNNLTKGDLRKRENTNVKLKLIKEIHYSFRLSSRNIADILGVNRETVRQAILSAEPSP